ncbi:12841_t:CDS:2, partial [Funneliformis mosseae]
EIIVTCKNDIDTPAKIYGFSSSKTRDINCEKEADASFCSIKLSVTASNGIVKVAYIESLDYVKEALKYWISPDHKHDCIL